MGLLDRLRIAHKLPLAMVGSALLVASGVGLVSSYIGSQTVSGLARQQMQTIAQARADAFSTYLTGIQSDVMATASSEVARTTLRDFSIAWGQFAKAPVERDPTEALQEAYITQNPNKEAERQLLDTSAGTTKTNYDFTHSKIHPTYRRQLELRGYADLFLLDATGNLIYSVMKQPDFAANFAAGGQWASTGLGQVYAQAMAMTEPGQVAFSDFSTYEPSHDAPAAFLASPVFDLRGKTIGVMAVRLSEANVNAVMSERNGLGETGESFIVGTDYRLRNDSTFSTQDDTLVTEYREPVVDAALAGNPAFAETNDYRGIPMLAAAIPLAFNGTNWAFVTTMGQDEVFAPVAGMRNTMLAIGGALLAVAALGGWLFSRSISRPLTGMAGAMDELASGNLSVEIEGGKRGDELGAMARALEVFRQNAHRMVDMTEEERAASLQRRSDRAEMMQALQRAFGQVVDAAVAGDFSRRIEVQFEDAELNVLADSVNNLVSTVDRGVSETGVVLAALADANLSIRMEGDYEGAFLDLKHNANRVAEKLTEVIGQLKSTSSSLKTATGEILSGANDLSERTSRQAATIEETSAAMEQLAATVLQNADRAREASQTAGTVTRTAEEGGQVMGAANNAMERIETSSSKISNIIGMIDDIAFQTNLLALNASVEAARAGEAGKGFAVVAVEVRRLAQSAAQASAEVKTLIEQSALEVKDGTRLVAEAAAKLEAMLASARSSNALMDSIAHESREQAAAIDEVNASVRQMDEMTQHNAALVEETNAAIEKTEAQARELDRVVDVFTLSRVPESGAGEAENLATLRAPPRNKSYRSEGNAALDTSWESF